MAYLNFRSIWLLTAVVSSVISVYGASAELDDPIVQALAGRHAVPTTAALTQLAGSEDALVKRLLELRESAPFPFVSIRAEARLLEFSARGDVQDALLKDVSDPRSKGLARVVAGGIDRVSDSDTRKRLANAVVKRSTSEEEFKAYANKMALSPHAEVREAAKSVDVKH